MAYLYNIKITTNSALPEHGNRGSMKTTVRQRVAKYLDVDISNVEIGESEHRENSEGKNLQNGCPVYVVMNTGVYEDELCSEFFGWVINGKWYRENC